MYIFSTKIQHAKDRTRSNRYKGKLRKKNQKRVARMLKK